MTVKEVKKGSVLRVNFEKKVHTNNKFIQYIKQVFIKLNISLLTCIN